jgi:hypothetical protein
MQRRAAIATSIVVALGVAVGIALLTGALNASDSASPASETASNDPRARALPPPRAKQAEATLAYLRANGSPLMVMHTTASEFANHFASDRCRSVASTLDQEAPSDEVLGLMGSIVDEPLRAAFTEERSVLGVALTACISGDTSAPLEMRVSELRDGARLLQTRLDQLDEAVR